ncbi:unnamed protein product [Urochloa humidicola]
MKSFPLLLLIALVAAPLAALNPFRPRLPPPRPPSTPPPPAARARSSSPDAGGGGDPPEECRDVLFNSLYSCLDFLTNDTVMRPRALCCEGFRWFLSSPAIPCLCHVLSGDINQYTHRPPINRLRAALLPVECTVVPPLRIFTMCIVEQIPPIGGNPPHPAPPPSSPVSSSGGGHA